jgi:hypothetical protein
MDEGRERSNAPDSVTLRRFPDGFEIALLPPPLLRYGRNGLLWGIIVSVVLAGAGIGLLSAFRQFFFPDFVILFAGVLLFFGLMAIMCQFNFRQEAAVLEARDGLLTLVRTHGNPSRQCPLAEIVSVRVVAYDEDRWQLQLDLKGGKRFSSLEGRRKAELDWVAGLLRAALAQSRRSPSLAETGVVYRSGGVCLVCGSKMDERVVSCSKCRTPHHEECWAWNGSCSTYGCREIRFTRSA